jgi:hypothetical protein
MQQRNDYDDPAHRLCTLVKAQSTVNSGALPNIIVMEIMARVQRDFDGYFAHVLDPTRPPLKLLWDKCSNTGALFRSNRGKKALSASCLFDGGDFLTLQGMATVEDNCDGTASRHGFFTANYRIDTGAVEGDSDSPISALKLGGTNHTLMLGFGSMIESIIRHNICGQNNVNDVSVCDTVNIPDQPDGVK